MEQYSKGKKFQNTGKFVSDSREEGGEVEAERFRQSRENDKIDSKFGFDRVKDGTERTGYLLNMHSTEILDEDRRLVAALDLFFIQMDGARFKCSIAYQPYFLIRPADNQLLELSRFLSRKYTGQLTNVEHITKEDLDLPNHLSGLTHNYLKLSFLNQTAMTKVRREIMSAVRKNTEREKSNTFYMQMLASSLAGINEHSTTDVKKQLDYFECIAEIREHDVPYHVRVSIDLNIFCGQWYNIRCRGGSLELPIITPRSDLIERPEPVVLAFDIETTKLPLKFPDAQTDRIMMISYMIDGQGFLITNREIISSNVDDFEYTPKPEFEGNFIVFNEPNEMQLIQKFFDHVMEVRPHIIVTYNGDFFDWPFVETRAAVYELDMKQEIGFSKSTRDGTYLCRPTIHMDCLCWVKRDSYLPVGSQGLKAVAKAKLRYDPVELDPEDMCKMAVEQPQVLSNYSVSDAVATYYLYMKYVHPFIFALNTIIPMEPDEILRKGSGTLCETLLMVQAYHANIVYPNKQQSELNKLSNEGHVLDSETYVGGHVEALESGVFRADIPYRFRLDPGMVKQLMDNIDTVLKQAIEVEEGVPLTKVTNLAETHKAIHDALQGLHDVPTRFEQPVIYHLDVGAMYPNIILTNRLQPSAMVTEIDCAACDFNKPGVRCKRSMDWLWRGEMLPASRNEFQRIQQQLETEKFPSLFPGGPTRAFHELSKEDQAAYEKKRLSDYCRKAYKKTKITKLETRTSTICQKENSFYVDTVRAFRDRRYEYKGLTKVAKSAVTQAIASGDAAEIKAAKGREVLYDSLQLAHKCILNSFYGYVMRRGARWHSMPMAGIVCLTGSNIIKKAREIIERVGRPLELDTDGIWCMLPSTFPQEFTVQTSYEKKKKINISYPNAVLNTMVKDHFTNDQYHELVKPAGPGMPPEYTVRDENSIFFEVDGPYLAMVLPAAKEEGKKLKKRYAVFNFDGSLAELKGFEVKRRGELQLIKNFQSSVFEAFLAGNTLEECYASVAKVADYWLDVLYSRGSNLPDSELFELISENKSMSKKLEDYGAQKSTSISTAKRLAEFLGEQMVKDAGLACKYIISKKPEGAPVTERAVPLAIFQSEPSVRRYHLRRWLKDNSMGDADIRDVLDWNYYIERLGGTIQKIITIPAALQSLPNPVPRVQHPDWLHKRVLEKNDVLKQRRISEMFSVKPKSRITEANEKENDEHCVVERELTDLEDIINDRTLSAAKPIHALVTKRKRANSGSEDNPDKTPEATTWRQALGPSPPIGITREEIVNWVRYQKKKWAWQLTQRQRYNQTSKRARTVDIRPEIHNHGASTSNASIGGFLRRNQRSLLENVWQILQISAVNDLGHFTVWAMIGDELHRIKLTVPRIFYVNQRTLALPEDGQMWKKVNRVLPRSRPVYNLYRYSVPEKVFKDNCLGMLADLATPDIEGIYETQVSLEFRALMDMGCLCSVQRDEARRMSSISTKEIEGFSIEQLEQKLHSNVKYLQGMNKRLRKIFLYQHNIPTAKKEIWGLFLVASKKAYIIALDSVRANQMPNMKSLYTAERLALIKNLQNADDVFKLPPDDFVFETLIEVNVKQVYRHIQRALSNYKDEKRGPTMLFMQTAIETRKLSAAMPVLLDFPQAQIHISDDASLLSGLDWQRQGSRALIRHFLNLNNVVELMLDQCRYFHVPIGNMPPDTVLFGADLFFARLLQKHNFVLWWSATTRPDLGGREVDDNRLLAEFEDSVTVVQNRPGFYPDVCVELSLDSLAVSALLQSVKIQEMEGASSAITFDIMPQASLEEMIGPSAATLPSYDETALCSAAFRVMRSMVNSWLREVSINQNIFSDFQIVHFYRWVRSSNALLYDPALRRSLNNLMRKMFLRIVAEFKRLGATIVYADFNRIILSTGKKLTADALGYVDYIVQSLRNKEMFHSIQLSFEHCWDFMLWLDHANYAGIRGKLPKSMENTVPAVAANAIDESEGEEEGIDIEEMVHKSAGIEDDGTSLADDEEQFSLELNWTVGESLPEENECREKFEALMTLYMQSLAERKSSKQAIKDISHPAFDYVIKLHKNYAKGKNSPGVSLVRTLVKVLSVDSILSEEINELRRNMLRLVGVGEFSDLAEWTDPCDSYAIAEVICKACNHCRDLDLCKDKHRALRDDIPVWLCAQCFVAYDNEEIEMRIIDVVQRKIMSYVLQDLRCKRCNEIMRDNLAEFCSCAGIFVPLISRTEIEKLLRTFLKVADYHKMQLLHETVQMQLLSIK